MSWDEEDFSGERSERREWHVGQIVFKGSAMYRITKVTEDDVEMELVREQIISRDGGKTAHLGNRKFRRMEAKMGKKS